LQCNFRRLGTRVTRCSRAAVAVKLQDLSADRYGRRADCNSCQTWRWARRWGRA